MIRDDVEIDSPRGRRMALADNAVARKNLDLDEDVIRAQAEAYDIQLESVGLSDIDLDNIKAASAAANLDTSTDTRLLNKDGGSTVKVVVRVPKVRVRRCARGEG